ncbi:unnamed protein product, partial [Scytosiphon promiscuus]
DANLSERAKSFRMCQVFRWADPQASWYPSLALCTRGCYFWRLFRRRSGIGTRRGQAGPRRVHQYDQLRCYVCKWKTQTRASVPEVCGITRAWFSRCICFQRRDTERGGASPTQTLPGSPASRECCAWVLSTCWRLARRTCCNSS